MNSSFFSMPGGFPSSPPRPTESSSHYPPPHESNIEGQDPQFFETSAQKAIDHEQSLSFEKKHYLIQKSKHQYHALNQLDTLVIVIAGYQLIKYCHSASVFPIVLHLIVQKLLCPSFVNNSERLGLASAIDHMTRDHRNEEVIVNGVTRPTKDQIISQLLRGTCKIIYWKFIITTVFHTFFVAGWMVLVADSGNLKKIENGTWWFVSFISESVPQNYNPESNIWYKLCVLGLPALIVSDLVILFIQLTMFQSLYRQSTIFFKDRRLNEEEVDIVRSQDECLKLSNTDFNIFEDQNGIPLVLRVKLYESLSNDAFLS